MKKKVHLNCIFHKWHTLRERIKSEQGLTLAETLLAVLIMSIIFTAVGGGVVVMKNNYEKVTLKAEGMTLLSTAVHAINMELESAKYNPTPSEAGDSIGGICIYSLHRNSMVIFTQEMSSKGQNIIYLLMSDSRGNPLEKSDEKRNALLSPGMMTKGLSVVLKNLNYDTGNGCFSYTVDVIPKGKPSEPVETETVYVKPINAWD